MTDPRDARLAAARNELAIAEAAYPPCRAVICHGPGHQSKSNCDRRGPHKLHHYEGPRGDFYWKGMKAFSGYFDESPEEEP